MGSKECGKKESISVLLQGGERLARKTGYVFVFIQ